MIDDPADLVAVTRGMIMGEVLPDGYVARDGDCAECGLECDGAECGLHALGCIFGGPDHGTYWLYHPDCPHDHGPLSDVSPLSAALDARDSEIARRVERELSKWDALWCAIFDAAAKAVKR